MSQAAVRDALASVQRMVAADPVWVLPEYVHVAPPLWRRAWQWLAVAVGAALLFGLWQSSRGAWLWLTPGLLLVGCAVRQGLSRRRSQPLGEGRTGAGTDRGCGVDVAQRRVWTQGCEPAGTWQLDPPQAWSLGYLPFADQPRGRYGWQIELRHARMGQVLALCTVLYPGRAEQPPPALDTLVTLMEQRLGLHRAALSLSMAPAHSQERAAMPAMSPRLCEILLPDVAAAWLTRVRREPARRACSRDGIRGPQGQAAGMAEVRKAGPRLGKVPAGRAQCGGVRHAYHAAGRGTTP